MITVYRTGFCEYIDDLSGTGAAMYGGRWNSEGVYILYTASSPSLSLLETWVHLNTMQLKNDFCRISLAIPSGSIREVPAALLPVDWNRFPAPQFLQQTGDDFISENKYLALKVPSAIEPEEWNYLLNPMHQDFKSIRVLQRKIIQFDRRMMKVP